MTKRTRQFLAAICAYGVFSILAVTTLTGEMRVAVLVVMAALALLTWLVWWRERQTNDDKRKQ